LLRCVRSLLAGGVRFLAPGQRRTFSQFWSQMSASLGREIALNPPGRSSPAARQFFPTEGRSAFAGLCSRHSTIAGGASAASAIMNASSLGIEPAFPSAMVATGATFVSVTWAGTSGPGLPQLAARSTRSS